MVYLNVDAPSPGESFLEKKHHIFALHSSALETLRPVGQLSNGKAFLLARERECEAQWKAASFEALLLDKVCQALGNVVKQLHPRPLHDLLGDRKHL